MFSLCVCGYIPFNNATNIIQKMFHFHCTMLKFETLMVHVNVTVGRSVYMYSNLVWHIFISSEGFFYCNINVSVIKINRHFKLFVCFQQYFRIISFIVTHNF